MNPYGCDMYLLVERRQTINKKKKRNKEPFYHDLKIIKQITAIERDLRGGHYKSGKTQTKGKSPLGNDI